MLYEWFFFKVTENTHTVVSTSLGVNRPESTKQEDSFETVTC